MKGEGGDPSAPLEQSLADVRSDLGYLGSVSVVQRWLQGSSGLAVNPHACPSLSLFSRPCFRGFRSESPSEGGERGEF